MMSSASGLRSPPGFGWSNAVPDTIKQFATRLEQLEINFFNSVPTFWTTTVKFRASLPFQISPPFLSPRSRAGAFTSSLGIRREQQFTCRPCPPAARATATKFGLTRSQFSSFVPTLKFHPCTPLTWNDLSMPSRILNRRSAAWVGMLAHVLEHKILPSSLGFGACDATHFHFCRGAVCRLFGYHFSSALWHTASVLRKGVGRLSGLFYQGHERSLSVSACSPSSVSASLSRFALSLVRLVLWICAWCQGALLHMCTARLQRLQATPLGHRPTQSGSC